MGNANHRSGSGKVRYIENADPSLRSPLLFHVTHSPSVRLSIDRRLVKRFDSCKGICFGSRPIGVGEVVAIKVVETATTSSRNGVLRFGYTCEDPDTIDPTELPKYASPDLTCEQGYWAKALPDKLVQRGNVLSFVLTPGGDVVYGCNGSACGIFFQGVETEVVLWALLDVFGSTISVAIVDAAQSFERNPEMPFASSDFTAGFPAALLRTASSTSMTLPTRSHSAQTRATASQRRSSRESHGRVAATTTMTSSLQGLPTFRNVEAPRSSAREIRSVSSTPSFLQRAAVAAPLNQRLPRSSATRGPAPDGLSSAEPMPFHYAIGRNICLSSDRLVATRLSEDYCNGYVFTCRPLRPGERLTIEITGVDLDYVGGLAVGMTACDPAEVRVHELPDDSDQLLDRPEYWVVHKDVCVKPIKGDEMTFYLTKRGEVRFSRNRIPVATLMHVDISLQLWFFFDVYGTTQRIRSLGITSKPSGAKNNHRTASSSSETSYTSSATLAASLDPFTSSLVRLDLTSKPSEFRSERPALDRDTIENDATRSFRDPTNVEDRSTVVDGRHKPPQFRQPIVPNLSDPISDLPGSLPPPLIPIPVLSSSSSGPPLSPVCDFPERSGRAVLTTAAAATLPDVCRLGDVVLKNEVEKTKNVGAPGNNSMSECAVCLERAPDCALYTCGHMCMCYECALHVVKAPGGALCPICRQSIRDVIRIFKS